MNDPRMQPMLWLRLVVVVAFTAYVLIQGSYIAGGIGLVLVVMISIQLYRIRKTMRDSLSK
ncbi:hypothetical protein N7326_00280 [Corynebacterium sp. ES2794-CONJ1]|uniref:hypothetical protein n=1 Tax=unclassified Corynebacterium TaxID=2624378 RepID=UPI002168C1F1|nr:MULTISPECIES: hypothetical protein [unclassified Corynebacterium]MCS4489364.1 hypothetical protein [Corynebacterium sp. ES2775-CONJ]MCS4530942.1 hypothetical protein [Corynebacterium sp. ES2730-CONJ]MCU9518309.1 hypothetical protein [Corynebacterium sp. ES2794-CONJ1]